MTYRSNLEIIVAADEITAGEIAAQLITQSVVADPHAALGVATGSSPLPVYRALASSGVDLGGVSAYALDEYVGLPPAHPQSYAAVLRRQFGEPLGIPAARLHVPAGNAVDLDAECIRYETAIADRGGVDVQLLGIGRNGHIGFNEPGSPLDSRTRLVELTESTRRDNARFFGSLAEVPTHSITQGLSTILMARRLVLIAQGDAKAPAVAAMLEGEISSAWPASVIRNHPDAVVVLDPAAAGRLHRFAA